MRRHVILASILLASNAMGQDECRTRTGALRTGCVHGRAADVTAESPVLGSQTGVRLEAARDKSKVDAFVGYEITDTEAAFLKVSAPIKEQQQQRSLANLSGLTAGTSITAGMYGILFSPKANVTEQDRVCNEYRTSDAYRENPDNPTDPAKFQCSLLTLPEPYRAQYQEAINWGPTPEIGGVQLTLNTNEFKYFTTDYAVAKETKNGYGIKAGVGRLPRGPIHFIGLAVGYEYAYKAQDEAQICTPVNGSAALRCATHALAAPKRESNLIATAEMRWFAGARAGVIPRVHYNFRKRDVGVELPIFFLQEENGGFNGGINITWQPEADGAAFSANMFFGLLTQAGRWWE